MTTSKAQCRSKGPGRPRSEKSREAIIQAALDLLDEQSLYDLSIEAIARQAKVGKATIYKWWPSKAHLVLEAFLEVKSRQAPVPDTGSIREDIQQHLTALADFHKSRSGQTIVHFLAQAQNDPVFMKELWNVFLGVVRDAFAGMLRRGIERGELREDVDITLMVDLIYAPMIYRQMIGLEPLDKAAIQGYVSCLLEGLGVR